MPAQRESLTIVDQWRLEQRAIARATANRIRVAWRGIVPTEREDGTRMSERIDVFAHAAESLVTTGQLVAVRSANRFVAAYLSSELRQPVAPLDDLDPHEFTGPHFTDRDLTIGRVLAISASRQAYAVLRGGPAQGDPVMAGEKRAVKLTRNEVLEAGRAALETIGTEHEIDGKRTFSGWTRGVMATGCPACISLADGRVLSWNSSMLTHHSCSCVQIPAVGDLPNTYPAPTGRELFNTLTERQQDSIYGAERAAAVRDGAPIDFAHETDDGLVVPKPQGVSHGH
jgi:hypothetical protein